jgi:hypothetical protein
VRLDLQLSRELLQRLARSSRSTASVFFPADQRGCDRWSLPCSSLLFTVMRAIFTLAYPVSNPTGSDGARTRSLAVVAAASHLPHLVICDCCHGATGM